jgi:ubiquinone biosynthesis monooxygenase Coq7
LSGSDFVQKPVPARPGAGAAAARLAEILRVDHAGELAAVHIYRGQKAVLGPRPEARERIASPWGRPPP